MCRHAPPPTLLPYTTLFRSAARVRLPRERGGPAPLPVHPGAALVRHRQRPLPPSSMGHARADVGVVLPERRARSGARADAGVAAGHHADVRRPALATPAELAAGLGARRGDAHA